MSFPHIVIIGAGVCGLSTALHLVRSGNFRVSVVSDAFSPNTTSDIAGAIVRPDYLGETSKELIAGWVTSTMEHLWDLNRSFGAPQSGISLISKYEFSQIQKERPFWSDIVFGFRDLTSNEISRISPNSAMGWFYSTFLVECTKYLPLLETFVREHGGCMYQLHVNQLSDVMSFFNDDVDVIINCTGLGLNNPNLFADELKAPARGQLVMIHAPTIKNSYGDYTDPHHPTYIYPRIDHVVVGGTYHIGDHNESINPQDTKKILERAAVFCPEVLTAPILNIKVGFRPYRKYVRIEKEMLSVELSSNPQQKKEICLIHNYGQGGAGVTVHWGCAGDTAKLAQEYLSLKNNRFQSRQLQIPRSTSLSINTQSNLPTIAVSSSIGQNFIGRTNNQSIRSCSCGLQGRCSNHRIQRKQNIKRITLTSRL